MQDLLQEKDVKAKENKGMSYSIEVENLTKIYKGFPANDGVNLKVPKGSIFGLIGRNGAGKTTLMKMILGFSSRTDGIIRINGKEREEELWKREDISALLLKYRRFTTR